MLQTKSTSTKIDAKCPNPSKKSPSPNVLTHSFIFQLPISQLIRKLRFFLRFTFARILTEFAFYSYLININYSSPVLMKRFLSSLRFIVPHVYFVVQSRCSMLRSAPELGKQKVFIQSLRSQ